MKFKIIKGDEQRKLNVPDGRYVAEVRINAGWNPRLEDERKPHTKRPLPLFSCRSARVLGVREDQITTHRCVDYTDLTMGHSNYRFQQVLIVSRQPFAVVIERIDPHQLEWNGPQALIPARQVHKGELGRRVSVDQLHTFRSKFPHPDSEREQMLQYVSLTELLRHTDLSAPQLMQSFACFSPSTHYEPNVPLLVRRSDHRGDKRLRVYVTKRPKSYCWGESRWGGSAMDLTHFLKHHLGEDLYVLHSWARLILLAIKFGYCPGTELPEYSCRVETPAPEQCQAEFPDLPVLELKTLRCQRGSELTREQFMHAAESMLGNDIWERATHLDDSPKNARHRATPGFLYYTGFQILKAHHDDIKVGVCNWTRAGANKSTNYWAGFITVCPGHYGGFDARRDKRHTYQVWIWPDQLVRNVPSGSVGGLVPENIARDPKLVGMVQGLLKILGFNYDEDEAAA